MFHVRKLSGTQKTLKKELAMVHQVPVTGLLHTFFLSQMSQSSRLLIKTAILMPEAKDGEVTIVVVESMGFNKTKVDWMMTIILI